LAAAPAVGIELGAVAVGAIGVVLASVVGVLVGTLVTTVPFPVGYRGVVVCSTGGDEVGTTPVLLGQMVVSSVTISVVELSGAGVEVDSHWPHWVAVLVVVSVATPLEVVAEKVGVHWSAGRVKVPLPLPEPP
jgi:hypothetical protein